MTGWPNCSRALSRAAVWGCVLYALAVAGAERSVDHLLVRFRPQASAYVDEAAEEGTTTVVHGNGPSAHSFAGRQARRFARLLRELDLPEGAELRVPAMGFAWRAFEPSPEYGDSADSLAPFFYLRLPMGVSAEEYLACLGNHPLVEYAERDAVNSGASESPNDPYFGEQWHLQNPNNPGGAIRVPEAWRVTRGSRDVLVAVVDTGLAPLPDFAGRIERGYNFVDDNENTDDDHGHGTAVTALLAAAGNDGQGAVGVDWNCRILPVKVLDASNHGLLSQEAVGIAYAVSRGAKVINFSIAGSEFNRTLQRAIYDAIAKGVLFVTVAGNEGVGQLSFPGYLSPCITVGATDQEGEVVPFSNAGPQLALVAPGFGIATLGLTGELTYVRGTSFAAPLVSGVCALLASVRPELTQAEARLLLCTGAHVRPDSSSSHRSFDVRQGWGQLDAGASLRLAMTRIEAIRQHGDRVTLFWHQPGLRDPFLFAVEYRESRSENWTLAGESAAYPSSEDLVAWKDRVLGPSRGGDRFYRLRLRDLPR